MLLLALPLILTLTYPQCNSLDLFNQSGLLTDEVELGLGIGLGIALEIALGLGLGIGIGLGPW